ncbi:Uncharacterised protein [uncultured Comamonas sp.]|nr:Uncharacterised protein [uncultured Comamonas sp.]
MFIGMSRSPEKGKRFQAGQRGGISVEYVVVCAVLALTLGIGMASDDSVLRQLLMAMRLSFSKLAYAFSLP